MSRTKANKPTPAQKITIPPRSAFEDLQLQHAQRDPY